MISKDRHFEIHHFLFSNRLYKILTNYYPNRNSRDQLFLFLVILTYILPSIVVMVYFYFISELTLHSTVKLIQKLAAALIMISAYSTFFFRFEKLQILIARLKLEHNEFTNIEELYILRKYSVQNKLYVYTVFVFFNFYCTSLIFPSIFDVFLLYIGKLEDNQLRLPFIEKRTFDSGVIYYSLLSYHILVLIILAPIGCFSVSTFLIFIQHACCQFTILRLKICQPFERYENYNGKCLHFCTESDEYNWIIDIINRHRKSIEFVKMLRYTSSEGYFVVIFLAMILVAFNFLCIMKYSELSENIIDKIELGVYVIGSFFTIYVNFYLGQKLLNHSNAIFVELCNVSFYTLSINTQKLLLFMIMRCGKPCSLSIGNMFVSSHEVFAGLMQKAFSFAMVYYSAQ